LPLTNPLHVSLLTTNAGNDATPWTVDRFWYVKKSTNAAISGAAKLRFEYPSTEATLSSSYTASEMKLQRFGNSGGAYNAWDIPYAGQSDGNFGPKQYVQVSADHIDTQNLIWVIVHTNSMQAPLPLQLVNFKAKQVKDKVQLLWNVMSENDVAKYTIRRTTNQIDYAQVATKLPVGPSTSLVSYEAWDNNPIMGLQYYQLASVMNDGSINYSNLLPIRYSTNLNFGITNVVAVSDASIQVNFNYDSELPYTYIVTDMMGRAITTGNNQYAKTGDNSIVIPVKISHGLYNISIMNTEKVATEKLFF
jgi:hypothetical protein